MIVHHFVEWCRETKLIPFRSCCTWLYDAGML